MAYVLNILYGLLLIAVSPLLAYKSWQTGKYRKGWGAKLFGHVAIDPSYQPRVWFHAVSVGEVLQLESIIDRLCVDVDVVISTTTSTGFNVANRKFPECEVCYFPLDFTWAVNNALNRIQPDVISLVELELWPNFIAEAYRRNIPTVVINGRLSEKSFRGYQRLSPVIRSTMSKLTAIGAQTEEYAERFIALGANAEYVSVTGSIKFDRIQTDRNSKDVRELRQELGIQPHEIVLLAGSTHAPEEEIALDTWQQLQAEFPNLRLMIAPRHAERFEEVAELIESKDIPLIRKSHGIFRFASVWKTDQTPVILLDTLGELSTAWGLADIAYVGGSLNNRGGQNMLEPAAFGSAVLFGPNTWNFKDVVDALRSRDAAMVVQNGEELKTRITELLNNPIRRCEVGRQAQQWVTSQQGASDETVAMLTEFLPDEEKPVLTPAA